MQQIKTAIFLFLLISIPPYCWGQKRIERFTVKVGATLPISDSYANLNEYTLVPEAEFLVNLPLYKAIQFSTGIGIESGKHIILEDVDGLVWRDDVKEWWPGTYSYRWNLDFVSMKVPVYLSLSFKKFFIDSFTFGYGLGWLTSYKLTEESIPNTSSIKINRTFREFSFGVTKRLFRFKKLSVGCTPGISYRSYLTDRNDWQKKCVLGEMKFNINF